MLNRQIRLTSTQQRKNGNACYGYKSNSASRISLRLQIGMGFGEIFNIEKGTGIGMGSPRKRPIKIRKVPPPPTPKPLKPWDAPAACIVGDLEEEAVFVAVGRALTNWGRVEHQLGEIFLALIGGIERSYEAMMAFGTIMSGRGRSDMIEAASKAYFLKRAEVAHLNTKKQLADLMLAVNGFADRRDRAWGRFSNVWGRLGPRRQRFRHHFRVNSVFFTTKKRKLSATERGHIAMVPTYSYSSKEIYEIADKFYKLIKPATVLTLAIRRQRHLEREATG